MKQLPRKWVLLDERGRITVPKYLLEALGIEKNNTVNYPLIIEAHPNLEECTVLSIKKGY